MQELETIKRMLSARNIDPMQEGLETAERKDVKQAYTHYQRALRENKNKNVVKKAHDACVAAIAVFDKTQSKSNQLEQLLGWINDS